MPQTFYSRPALPVSTPAANGELGMDSSGRMLFYNGTLSRTVMVDDGYEMNTFSMTSTLVTATGKARWYIEVPCTWVSGRLSVGTAPTGAAVIVDVNKNGTTLYTTQGNRPTVAISGFTQSSTTPDVTTFTTGDYVTIDVDQIGSTIAGADLTFTLRLRRT